MNRDLHFVARKMIYLSAMLMKLRKF